MYARVTWYRGAGGKLDAGIDVIEQALPAVQRWQGYAGFVLLVDRAAEEAVGVVYYKDEASLKVNTENAARARQEAVERLGLEPLGVDELEITIADRVKPPAANTWARVITGSARRDMIDAAVAAIKERGLPILQAQKGYRSFVSGANRETGRSVAASTFDTREELDASDAAMAGFREQVRAQGGLEDVKVQVFELAFANVPAPITAGA